MICKGRTDNKVTRMSSNSDFCSSDPYTIKPLAHLYKMMTYKIEEISVYKVSAEHLAAPTENRNTKHECSTSAFPSGWKL